MDSSDCEALKFRSDTGRTVKPRLPKAPVANLLGQICQEMGFPRPVVADQKRAAACFFGKQSLQGFEMPAGLLGYVIAGADPTGICGLQMIEPDDGGLGGNLDMVTDFQWIHPLRPVSL